MRRVALIVNPVAGRGRAAAAAQKARRVLRGAGLDVRDHVTTRAGEAQEVARTESGDVDAVVVVGGDGTLREAAAGLGGASTPLGLVPVGTANVVARELRIPFSPGRAAQLVLDGVCQEIDVGRVNDHLFLAMVGVGFDGEVVHKVAQRRARSGSISKLSYLRPAFGTLCRYRPRPMAVTVDGSSSVGKAYALVVCNTRNYAAHFVATPRADPSDGYLDFMAQTRSGSLATLRCFASLCLRRCAPQTIARYGRGREILVETDRGVAVQADGDWLGRTRRIRISLLEVPVRIIAPPDKKNGASPK